MGTGRRNLSVRPGPDPNQCCQHQVRPSDQDLSSVLCPLSGHVTVVTPPGLIFPSSRSFSVILVVDLSKPNSLWTTVEKLLQTARAQLEKVFAQVHQKQKTKNETAVSPAARVLPKDHPVRSQFHSCKCKGSNNWCNHFSRCSTLVSSILFFSQDFSFHCITRSDCVLCVPQDRELIHPFPVPLLIIGSKYDLFQVKMIQNHPVSVSQSQTSEQFDLCFRKWILTRRELSVRRYVSFLTSTPPL